MNTYKVVLVLGTNQLLDLDVALDVLLVKDILEDLVVFDKLVLVLGRKVHIVERDLSRED